MHKMWNKILTAGLVAMFLLAPLSAKTISFTLGAEAKIGTVTLDPGDYRLETGSDSRVNIYDSRHNLVAEAEGTLQPLGGATPQSIIVSKGMLQEVRLKKEKIVFASGSGDN